MPKTHKLTEVEQKHLRTISSISGTLSSWANTYEYLIGLVDKDRQKYVDDNVRVRLDLKKTEGTEPDIKVDSEKGTVTEL